MIAREFFESASMAVRMRDVAQAVIDNEGEEWSPCSPGSNGISDPTASAAERSIERQNAVRDALLIRDECDREIGSCLEVIEGIRQVFGDGFADVLDLHYIDLLPWWAVALEVKASESTCKRRRNLMFEWIDAMGIARAKVVSVPSKTP